LKKGSVDVSSFKERIHLDGNVRYEIFAQGVEKSFQTRPSRGHFQRVLNPSVTTIVRRPRTETTLKLAIRSIFLGRGDGHDAVGCRRVGHGMAVVSTSTTASAATRACLEPSRPGVPVFPFRLGSTTADCLGPRRQARAASFKERWSAHAPPVCCHGDLFALSVGQIRDSHAQGRDHQE
jgi:hypothetical protein